MIATALGSLLAIATPAIGAAKHVSPTSQRRMCPREAADARRLKSLRFTRSAYLRTLRVAIDLQRAGIDPLPDVLSCYDPAAAGRELQRSDRARAILRRHRLPIPAYLDGIWSIAAASIDDTLLDGVTDAVRANRALLADPELSRLFAALGNN